ncbi:MAG: 4Fe-4S binding protein [Candidatus Helarchaeota archaeon]|nr:4Fe-4S binding protein [Candidatus Helarchaeota archaeon]
MSFLSENEDIYRKLQQHLDTGPIGFPRAKSGSDIRLLKAFFNPKQAEFATKLSFFPSPLKSIYRRTKKEGMSLEETKDMLDDLVENGLILHADIPDTGERIYLNAPLAVGFYEFNVNRLTKERAEAFDEYLNEEFIDEYNLSGIPQLRTIPLNAALTSDNIVMTYDDVKQLIETHKGPYSVQDCICTQEKEILGTPCKHSFTDRCLSNNQWMIDRGDAREISKEEVFKILKKAEEDCLVIQPWNFQEPGLLCICCGCCCGILSNIKKLDKPSQYFATNYYSEVDGDLCSGCGTCADRCPMDAITIEDVSIVDRDRCIGCGVCVPTCPSDAIHLRNKEDVLEPPKNLIDMWRKIGAKKAELSKATINK